MSGRKLFVDELRETMAEVDQQPVAALVTLIQRFGSALALIAGVQPVAEKNQRVRTDRMVVAFAALLDQLLQLFRDQAGGASPSAANLKSAIMRRPLG